MSEPTPLYDASAVHLADQQQATMAALGRAYAALWRALTEGGVPPTVAAEMVHRQQGAALTVWMQAQAGS